MVSIHQEHAQIFKAVCDSKRLAILELLRDGEKCACTLTELTGIPQTALSYHMKILQDSNLVVSYKSGKWVNYALHQRGCQEAVALLERLTTPNQAQTPNCCFL